jgi:hypothetical protein
MCSLSPLVGSGREVKTIMGLRLRQVFWRWKCRHGRPPLPQDIRNLIARMARENPTWGQARVANELSLKPCPGELRNRRVIARRVLGGLHHEYAWSQAA